MGWEVGDLALCVVSGQWLKAGRCYVVSDVRADYETWSGENHGDVGLVLGGMAHGTNKFGQFWSGNFRKITPGAKIEGVEERRRLPVREDA